VPKNCNPNQNVVEVPKTRYVLFLAVASVGCLADLLTKHWIFDWRGMPGEKPIWWLVPNYVGIETTLNTGGLFGLGQGSVIYLMMFSFVALAGIIYWFVFFRIGSDRWLTLTFGIITGGILGNLHDRLGLWSPVGEQAVRDWILLRYSEPLTWPNFNIADSLLVCGAASLFLHSFRTTREAPGSSSRTPISRNEPQRSEVSVKNASPT
jgi:signal peptidase II